MMENLDISVVTYNSKKWLKNFFESLLSQSYPTKNINLFFRDNGSSDDTFETLEELGRIYKDKFHSIEMEKGENVGFGEGHNCNLKKSASKFFLVTNVDLEFEKESIKNIIQIALEDSENVAAWEFRQKPFEHPKYYNPVTLETDWCSGACTLFRSDLLKSVGGFEPKIFMYGEDVELSFRLRAKGYILRYVPSSVCWHYTYEDENDFKPLQYFGSTLANFYIRLRYGKIKDMFAILPLFISLFVFPPYFKGKYRGLLKNLFYLLSNSFYFLSTRLKGDFNFYLFDYTIRRDGAFYRYKNESYDDLVSIIVRFYGNNINKLKEAIKSIENQTYKNIEVILIEDGSQNAKEYAKSLKDKLNIVYKSIPHSGRCVAGNVGLELAKGKFVNFLDDDDLLFAEHIEVLVSEIKNSGFCGVYSTAFEVKTSFLDKAKWIYKEQEHNVYYRQPFSKIVLWHHNFMPIQSVLFKRELYERYGGFDEELENLEDWLLWIKYTQECDFKLIEKTTSLYRVPANEEESRNRQEKLDFYYKIATKKRDELNIKTSPKEALKWVEEFNRYMMVCPQSTLLLKLRERAKKYRILRKSYRALKKILNRF